MNREEKKQSVSEIKEMIGSNDTALIVYYQGLTAAQIHGLRGLLLDSGAKMKVIKNSLAKLAIKDTLAGGLESMLSGPTALVVANDPVSVTKTLTKFAKDINALVMVGGMVENQLVDKKSIAALADMPSKDELRAKIIAIINTPATKLVRLLNTPATQVARVIDGFAQKSA